MAASESAATETSVSNDSDSSSSMDDSKDQLLLEDSSSGGGMMLRSRFRSCLHEVETMAHHVCDDVDLAAVASAAKESAGRMAHQAKESAEWMAHQAVESAERMAHQAVESAERMAHHAVESVKRVWEGVHFSHLPAWLQDNDFLHHMHRPPLPSFSACFRSIFRVHTETGNIWTHMIGCLAFICVASYFLTRPSVEVDIQEKLVFAAFFAGAILCLGMSFAFHTVSCHSEFVGKLFGKLDYCGIAFLIMGSFVPWLYYGFYCEFLPKVIYLSITTVLGLCAIGVSLWDKFGEPKYRPFRAGVFMGFGLSGVIPAVHYLYVEGVFKAARETAMGSLVLMAFLYISGALLYAWRIPERYFPGKCDIWFQSHQLFHVLVIAAAFVHYHGISEMAVYRLTTGVCAAE